MEQRYTAVEETTQHSNNFDLLTDSFNQNELAVADILLLLSNSKPKKPNKKVKNDNRESQSFLPNWACRRRRSASNRQVAAPPPANDTIDKEKACLAKDLPPSPATHPLLLSSSESDEKLNFKIRVFQNKKRHVLEENFDGLVGCRELLREELHKKKTYHSHLQAINSALKTMKQDVMAETSCSSSMNCSWQTQIQNFHQPYNRQMGNGALLFLSSAPHPHHHPQLVVNNRPNLNAVHPADVRRIFSESEKKKAECAAARQLRMASKKMKQTRRLPSSSSSSTANIKPH